MMRNQPDIVLVGNSMLRTSVDPKMLSLKIGQSVLSLEHGGTASAAWYLTIKNVALDGPRKPRMIILFFRDHFLTYPTYRVRGNYKAYLEDLSDGFEPLLEDLVFKKSRLEYLLEILFPAYAYRKSIRDMLNNGVKTACGKLVDVHDGTAPDVRTTAALRDVFDDEKMDNEIATKQQSAAEDVEVDKSFGRVAARSFLPHIISMVKRHGVALVLVRVKRRSVALHKPESVRLKKYMADLRAFLASHDIPLIDMTYEERIQIEHYGKGDHIDRQKGRPLFTGILAEKLRPYL